MNDRENPARLQRRMNRQKKRDIAEEKKKYGPHSASWKYIREALKAQETEDELKSYRSVHDCAND